MAFKRILVPVDYSEPSRKALELALRLEGDAEINAVHVWDRPSYVSSDEVVTHQDGSRRSLGELIRDNAEREMADFLATVAAPPGRQFAHHLLSGEPVSIILAEANRGYDLLVVGTHGRTGMKRLLLGSVAEKLIRLAPIPVLTVPSEARVSDR